MVASISNPLLCVNKCKSYLFSVKSSNNWSSLRIDTDRLESGLSFVCKKNKLKGSYSERRDDRQTRLLISVLHTGVKFENSATFSVEVIFLKFKKYAKWSLNRLVSESFRFLQIFENHIFQYQYLNMYIQVKFRPNLLLQWTSSRILLDIQQSNSIRRPVDSSGRPIEILLDVHQKFLFHLSMKLVCNSKKFEVNQWTSSKILLDIQQNLEDVHQKFYWKSSRPDDLGQYHLKLVCIKKSLEILQEEPDTKHQIKPVCHFDEFASQHQASFGFPAYVVLLTQVPDG